MSLVQVGSCVEKDQGQSVFVVSGPQRRRACVQMPTPLTSEASSVMLNSCRVCSTRMREFTNDRSLINAESSYIWAVMGQSARSAIQWCSRWSLWAADTQTFETKTTSRARALLTVPSAYLAPRQTSIWNLPSLPMFLDVLLMARMKRQKWCTLVCQFSSAVTSRCSALSK